MLARRFWLAGVFGIVSHLERFRYGSLLAVYAEGPPNKGKGANLPFRRFLNALSTIGAKLTPGGSLTRQAAPVLSLFEVNTKELKPYLRDMVRYKLMANLAERSATICERGGQTLIQYS